MGRGLRDTLPSMADRTESTARIAAPPAEVLAVVADLESYPQWAREMTSVSVLDRDDAGRARQVQISLDAGLVKDTYVLDYVWDVDDDGVGEVRWSLVRASLLKAMDGSYVLTPAEGGTATEVTYRLAVDLSVPMLGLVRRRAEKSIVTTALDNLRRRVEGRG